MALLTIHCILGHCFSNGTVNKEIKITFSNIGNIKFVKIVYNTIFQHLPITHVNKFVPNLHDWDGPNTEFDLVIQSQSIIRFVHDLLINLVII